MVVDDDATIRHALAELLIDDGHEVVSVENGREALARLRDGSPRPCLILLDLMMPVMSGHEFLDHRSKDPELAGIPTVVITAAAPRNLRHRVPVLYKPLRAHTVLSVLQQHC
jgi:CheY-like chemotaxis protein